MKPRISFSKKMIDKHLARLIKRGQKGDNKMAEEYVDVEYISLRGYTRNTPSDTEVDAEHQLRADRSTWPMEKTI